MADGGPQLLAVTAADAAVDPVSGDYEVGVAGQVVDVDLGFESDVDAEALGAPGQDFKETHAGEGSEAVAV